ncbi:MAG TPA: NAD-dependent epimerase/dehydratase family protein, partial [Mycobacteriales bacterium]|nr:NAD-dependent epimerase/dehydratase family protein [Mycobacteriales bacterium]
MGVVVTGAAGFLGRALVASLVADGHTVTTLDRRPLSPAAPDLPAGLDTYAAATPPRLPGRTGPAGPGGPGGPAGPVDMSDPRGPGGPGGMTDLR